MNQPPKWARRILNRYVDNYLLDEIYGDLLEEYHQNIKAGKKANWLFIQEVIKYLKHSHLLQFNKQTQNSNSMDIWRNYFVTSIRNLSKNKRYTAISLIGLVVGFASAIAIFQYAHYESSYDSFLGDKQINRVSHTFTNNTGVTETANTFMAVKDAIQAEIPEVQQVTHFSRAGGTVKVDQEVFSGDFILAAGSEFFEVFPLPLLGGTSESLDDPNVILISESTALKYFGTTDAVNKTVEMQGVFGETYDARVGGVFEDIPENSHLQVDLFFSMNKLLNAFRQNNFFGDITFDAIPWRLLGYPTYLVLDEQADKSKVVSQLNEIIATNRESINKQLNQKHEVWLQPVQEIHTTPNISAELKPSNDRQVILLFLIIAVFILAIAWINYINLATARSVSRGKEVGIRKVLGSHRSQLRNQFLIEAFVLNFMALTIALALLVPISGVLEEIVGVQFFKDIFSNLGLLSIIIFVLLGGSILSGLYPAFTLSGYDCLETLKGKIQSTSGGILLRRILVVSQFVFSIFLISALLIVQSQMTFMLNSNLGVSIDQTFLVNASGNIGSEGYTSKMETLKTSLNTIPGVEKVSISTMVPGIANIWRNSIEQRGEGEGAGLFIHRVLMDEKFIGLYDLNLLAGRNVSKTHGAKGTSILINEHAREQLGFLNAEAAINEKIHFAGEEYNVVGVLENFYQLGVHNAYEPMSFQLDTALVGNFISVNTSSDNLQNTLVKIEDAYKSSFPDAPFVGRFLDDVFQNQYVSEFRFRNLFSIFSGIALLIACLGLIGLSSYMINQKLKEISIRKVLGANAGGLFYLLNREYIVISLLSFLIAGPAIYTLNPFWLDTFANRIAVHPGYYIIPLLLILIIVLITTLGYTIKAISVNPAKTLKEE